MRLSLIGAACFLGAAAGGCAPTTVRVAEEPRPAPPPPLFERMTDDDLALADTAVDKALRTGLSGERFAWSNRISGNDGAVWVVRTYRTVGGSYCRVYRERVSIGAEGELYEDLACLDEAGVWRIME